MATKLKDRKNNNDAAVVIGVIDESSFEYGEAPKFENNYQPDAVRAAAYGQAYTKAISESLGWAANIKRKEKCE